MSRLITIKETAKIEKKVDFVILTLTIETTEKKCADAVEQSKQKLQQINVALEKVGIGKECAKITDYNVHPYYNYGQSKKGTLQRNLEGYTCTYRLKIEMSYDSESLQKVLDAIPLCLSNPQMHIVFTVKDKNALYGELMKIIAENAKRKAEILCDTAGATLGKLMTVEYHKSDMVDEHTTNFLTPLPRTLGDTGPLLEAPQLGITPRDIIMSDSATFVWEIE